MRASGALTINPTRLATHHQRTSRPPRAARACHPKWSLVGFRAWGFGLGVGIRDMGFQVQGLGL